MVNKKNNSLSEFIGNGNKRDEKIKMRIKENYIPTYNKLNNSVINLHTKNIKEQVHKVKQKLDV